MKLFKALLVAAVVAGTTSAFAGDRDFKVFGEDAEGNPVSFVLSKKAEGQNADSRSFEFTYSDGRQPLKVMTQKMTEVACASEEEETTSSDCIMTVYSNEGSGDETLYVFKLKEYSSNYNAGQIVINDTQYNWVISSRE